MKNVIKKIMVMTLATTLVMNTCVVNTYAKELDNKNEYVLCKADGEVKKYIVFDDEANKLQYMSEDAQYPLKVKVNYKLAGQELTPEEIKGKSGDCVIDINYEGKTSDFSAVTVIMLSENHFSDIKVTGGKIISDGDKDIAVAVTKIPGVMHLEAKANDFEIGAMYAVATDSLMGEVDIEEFAPVLGIDVEGIKNTINELKDVKAKGDDKNMSISEGIGELTEGIGQLSDGLTTLDDNSGQLVDGAKQVFQSLIDMANKEIAASGADIETLTISNYSRVLQNAINQASPDGVTKTAKTMVEGKVRDNEATIRMAVEQAVLAQVTGQVTEKVKEAVEGNVLTAMGLTQEDFNKALAAGMVTQDTVDGIVNEKLADPAVKAKISAGVQEQMASPNIQKIINEKTQEQIAKLVDENMNTPEVQGQIAVGIAKGNAGAPALKALKSKLDSYNKFYIGLKQYTEGVNAAAEGADTINKATSEIAGSTKSLFEGDALKLIDNADDLMKKADEKKCSVKYIIKFDSIR